jgi:hypothetical protein
MIHNLDHSTALLNNSKYFASRVSINTNSIKHLENVVRRLYRLFSHAYFHHMDIFNDFEV